MPRKAPNDRIRFEATQRRLVDKIRKETGQTPPRMPARGAIEERDELPIPDNMYTMEEVWDATSGNHVIRVKYRGNAVSQSTSPDPYAAWQGVSIPAQGMPISRQSMQQRVARIANLIVDEDEEMATKRKKQKPKKSKKRKNTKPKGRIRPMMHSKWWEGANPADKQRTFQMTKSVIDDLVNDGWRYVKSNVTGERVMSQSIDQLVRFMRPGMILRVQDPSVSGNGWIEGEVLCYHPDGQYCIKNPLNLSTGRIESGSLCNSHANQPMAGWMLNIHQRYLFEIPLPEGSYTAGEIKKAETTFVPGTKIMDFVGRLIAHEKNPERLKWLQTLQRCVLPPDVQAVIEEALTVVLCKDKFDTWGVNEHYEKGITNAILLYGPPGTGKTMISESIAAVLGKNLLKVDNAAIQSQIPGQAERNITANFKLAKEQNAVLMFDECDSLLYNRDAVGMILASEINHLLTEIERFDGVCVLTTNRLGRLDPALQRRIIAKVELPIPDEAARVQIWKNLLPPKVPLGDCVKVEELAKHPIAGGDIKNAILLAIRKAIATNADKLTQEHLTVATNGVVKAKEDFADNAPKPLHGNKWSAAREGSAHVSSEGYTKTVNFVRGYDKVRTAS